MHSSRLRNSTTPADFSAQTPQTIRRQSSSPSPERKRKMTITQTYVLAHAARSKLSSEAARGDHDLRLLVGHANLLDALTLDLQQAEREQDAWFEKTVAETRKAGEPKRVQWTDQVAAQAEEDLDIPDASDDDSEADSDDGDDIYDDGSFTVIPVPTRRRRAPSPMAMDIDRDIYDDEEQDNDELQLVRTTSRSGQPPELVHDHDSSDDEDEDLSPVSPPEASFPLPQQIKTKDFATVDQSHLYSMPPSTHAATAF